MGYICQIVRKKSMGE
jgi:Transport and Golgi organisation 2